MTDNAGDWIGSLPLSLFNGHGDPTSERQLAIFKVHKAAGDKDTAAMLAIADAVKYGISNVNRFYEKRMRETLPEKAAP